MATGNLDAADLAAVDFNGLLNEDAMQDIWDISQIPLPFTDLIGASDSVSNQYTEWTVDRLQAQNLDNAKVDGADTIADNDTNTGNRVGNRTQISTKTVQVSDNAEDSDSIGNSGSMAYQVMMRQQELRRDVEGTTLKGTQGSQVDDGSTTPGLAGDYPSWIVTNADIPGDGVLGGFSAGAVTGYTPGTARAGSYANLNQLIEDVWVGGGDPSTIMSVPSLIRAFTKGVVDGTAEVAPLRANVTGESPTDMVSQDSVNVYKTQHGPTLRIEANRLQPTYTTVAAGTGAQLLVIDPGYVRHGYLSGYRTQPLAKTGLSEKSQMSVTWTVKVLNEEAHGIYSDLDPSLAWVA